MNRLVGAVCSAAVLVAATACGPFDDDGPPRQLVFPEPASRSAQWIVDAVSPEDERPPQCPRPTLSTLAVLSDEGSWAQAFWVVDDVNVCSVVIDNVNTHWKGVEFQPIDGLITSKPEAYNSSFPTPDSYIFTVFHGAVRGLRASGGTGHLVGSVHARTVVLGYGEVVTFVGLHVLLPGPGESVPLDLCPADGPCRAATIDGVPAHFGPDPTPGASA
ncbi:hypothetical protein ACPC54_09400 [Kitasatospora sp. NPDC094028]